MINLSGMKHLSGMGTYRDSVKRKGDKIGMGIVCMCIIMRWSQNCSASWAEILDLIIMHIQSYSPIPILSPFLFTRSLFAPILNLKDFSFTCIIYNSVHTYTNVKVPQHFPLKSTSAKPCH